MAAYNISRDIQQLISKFIDPAVSSQYQFARTPALGHVQIDVAQLGRQLKKRTFEILLSHRDDQTSGDGDLTVFDCLYATCYDKRQRRKPLDADRLSELVDHLRSTSTTGSGVTSVLRFLLNLARAHTTSVDCLGHESWRLDFGSSRNRRRLTNGRRVAAGAHIYEDIPSSIFEGSGWCADTQSKFGAFSSKVFSLHPGFESRGQPLKCSLSWSSDTNAALSSSLFGALLHPLPDPWQIDVKLDLPELGDDAPRGFRAYRHYYRSGGALQPRTSFSLTDISSRTDTTRSDEDEGFVETDSPSSATSGRRLINDVVDIWELAAQQVALDSHSKTQYRTWETLGCAVPQPERPLLTEAGPLALDHVALSQRHQLAILLPGEQSRAFREIPLSSAGDVLRDSFNVLMGIESVTYRFNAAACGFTVPDCRCSGLTPEALHGLLEELAETGTDHFRLEQLVAMVTNTVGHGKVTRCLASGVRRFLHQKCAVVSGWLDASRSRSGLSGRRDGFLSFMEKTAKLRKQTRFVADVCMVSPDSGLVSLPSGVHLLSHLHAATVDASSDPHLFPVALALLRRATEPYFRFVRAWIFDGQCDDENEEFPIQVVPKLGTCADSRFWTNGFRLVCGDEEPVLGPLLHTAFVCGKSLRLLRLCHPTHQLFRPLRAFPALTLTFAKTRLRLVEEDSQQYFADVVADTHDVRTMAELRRSEQRRLKEAVLVRAQEVRRSRLAAHYTEQLEQRKRDADRKRKQFDDIQAQIEAKARHTNEIKIKHVKPDVPLIESTSDDHRLTHDDKMVMPARRTCDSLQTQDNLRDSNANTITADPLLSSNVIIDDVNANRKTEVIVEVPVHRRTRVGELQSEVDSSVKGVKRKQDRESINFDLPQSVRRTPPRDVGAAAASNGERARRSVVFADTDPGPGETTPTTLVEGSTFQVLRTRGRSVHGHASDSTIQRLMYGDTPGGGSLQGIAHPMKSSKNAAAVPSGLEKQTLETFSNLKISSYTHGFPQLTKYAAMSDIFKTSLSLERINADQPTETTGGAGKDDEDYCDLSPLPVVLNTCVYQPLQAQASLVNQSLLNYFMIDCRLEQHFDFIRHHFFMQDGEFAQRLCELLFERVSKVENPGELFNLVTLNTILAKSYSYSSWATATTSGEVGEESTATSDNWKNLSFAVKAIPTSFRLNSPAVLDSLKLVYRTSWPCNIVFSPEASKYYESIFSFLLQLRYCMWALAEAYQMLKANDPASTCRPKSSGSYRLDHYRQLQLYRQEMHHFVRSLHEYLNLQAFQITHADFARSMDEVGSLDDLIALHIKYLQKISFRCLLQKKAAPLMKILHSTLSVILTFCSQVAPPMADGRQMTDEHMTRIRTEHDKFKQQSCYLFEVLTKVVHKGYNPPLREFLMRLDYNGYFTASLASGAGPAAADQCQ